MCVAWTSVLVKSKELATALLSAATDQLVPCIMLKSSLFALLHVCDANKDAVSKILLSEQLAMQAAMQLAKHLSNVNSYSTLSLQFKLLYKFYSTGARGL